MMWQKNILRAIWGRHAAAENPQSSASALRTRRRGDLFEICTQVIEAIEPAFLQDPASPVFIALEGTSAGGKSIFRDATLSALFGDAAKCAFRGVSEYAGMWRGEVDGRMLEVAFLNAYGEGAAEFIGKREHGGVTLISNGYELASSSAILDKRGKIVIELINPRIQGGWERSVAIKADDERLLNSARWTAGLAALKRQENEQGFFKPRRRAWLRRYPRPPYRESQNWQPGRRVKGGLTV